MVEDIYKKTGETINANTLRRFFGLVKADYPPSHSTLTILSKYCGFNSTEEIASISQHGTAETSVNNEEVLRYLVSLFRNTQVAPTQERTFFPIVEQTVAFLERTPSLIDKFQREIAKTPTGQYYYYEKLVNIDRLNGYYGEGLRHYLRSKTNEEGKVFAHSMQVFRHWLTRNKEELLRHYAEIEKIDPASQFPDHILGRFIAARIYHAHVTRGAIDKVLVESKRFHGGIIARREDSPFSFPDFELILCEALLLTGHFDEGAEYIFYGKNYLSASGQEDKSALYNLWEDFLNYRREPRSSGKDARPDAGTGTSSFSRKYDMLIRLLSMPSNTANSIYLKDLVKETGFKRLLSLSS